VGTGYIFHRGKVARA